MHGTRESRPSLARHQRGDGKRKSLQRSKSSKSHRLRSNIGGYKKGKGTSRRELRNLGGGGTAHGTISSSKRLGPGRNKSSKKRAVDMIVNEFASGSMALDQQSHKSSKYLPHHDSLVDDD